MYYSTFMIYNNWRYKHMSMHMNSYVTPGVSLHGINIFMGEKNPAVCTQR